MKKVILILSAVLCLAASVCSCSDKLSGSADSSEFSSLIVGRWSVVKTEEYEGDKCVNTETPQGDEELDFSEFGICTFYGPGPEDIDRLRYSINGGDLDMEGDIYHIQKMNKKEMILVYDTGYIHTANGGKKVTDTEWIYLKRIK